MFRRTALPAALALALMAAPATAGEAEVRSAQTVISNQIEAFLAGDHEQAYGYAAPGIKRLFPTLERFMNMVISGYQPVYRPQDFAFGKTEEMSATSIAQQVLLTGPDGKSYEALYTLELQPDGTWRITGVSLRASSALST